MYISGYLKRFVISGGIDPYADVIGSEKKASKANNSGQAPSGDSAVVNDIMQGEDIVGDVVAKTTVRSRKLRNLKEIT